MFETICAVCDHVWHALNPDRCPMCGQDEIFSHDDSDTVEDWDSGHFEGGFPSGPGKDYE